MRFHGTVNALSGNPVLIEVTEAQRPQIRRVMVVITFDPAITKRIWREHEAIAGAICAGDAERAGTLARTHALWPGEATRQRPIPTVRARDPDAKMDEPWVRGREGPPR